MSERTGAGFLSRVGWVLGPLLLLGIGLFAIGNGTHLWWVAHSGIPAQVKILAGCHSPVSSHSATCPAAWIQADGTERTVTVHGDDREVAYGKTVDVHIRGDQACPNSESAWGPVGIPIGIALAGFGLWMLLPTRRRKRDQGPHPRRPTIREHPKPKSLEAARDLPLNRPGMSGDGAGCGPSLANPSSPTGTPRRRELYECTHAEVRVFEFGQSGQRPI